MSIIEQMMQKLYKKIREAIHLHPPQKDVLLLSFQIQPKNGKTDGFIGLSGLSFNGFNVNGIDWRALNNFHALVMVEGHDIVIRRKGKNIMVYRIV